MGYYKDAYKFCADYGDVGINSRLSMDRHDENSQVVGELGNPGIVQEKLPILPSLPGETSGRSGLVK